MAAGLLAHQHLLWLLDIWMLRWWWRLENHAPCRYSHGHSYQTHQQMLGCSTRDTILQSLTHLIWRVQEVLTVFRCFPKDTDYTEINNIPLTLSLLFVFQV